MILRQSNANNVVAANLYLLGGARQITDANAGIETFLLEVSDRGTAKYPKAILRRKMSRLGSEINTIPNDDWTMFGVHATTEVLDSTWAIFADRLMAPTLDPEDIALLKTQFVSGIRQRRDDPDALAEYLADSIAFTGHPYGIPVTGTEQSISSLNSKILRDYLTKQFVKSRMLLVVVGDVDRAHVERLVRNDVGETASGQLRVDSAAEAAGEISSGRDRAKDASDKLHRWILQRSACQQRRLSGAPNRYVSSDRQNVLRNQNTSESYL